MEVRIELIYIFTGSEIKQFQSYAKKGKGYLFKSCTSGNK